MTNWPPWRINPMRTHLTCSVTLHSTHRYGTRRERAQRLRSEKKDFSTIRAEYGPEARQILDESVGASTSSMGRRSLSSPTWLEVPPLSEHGNVMQIARYCRFSGEEKLGGCHTEVAGPSLYAA